VSCDSDKVRSMKIHGSCCVWSFGSLIKRVVFGSSLNGSQVTTSSKHINSQTHFASPTFDYTSLTELEMFCVEFSGLYVLKIIDDLY
jgi:hypothetical protein